MKNTFFRALLTGLLFVFFYYLTKMVQGMYLTKNYVSDVTDRTQPVDNLQHAVAFGKASDPMWQMIEVTGLMLLGMAVYYAWRLLRRKS